jgi:stage II sporulation protein D
VALLGKSILSAITQPTTNRTKVLLRFFLLFWLISLSGCAKRETIEPACQMDVKPEFWIRVLLLDDIQGCRLKPDSSFAIINAHAQISEAHFERVDAPIDVKILNGKITIGGWTSANEELIIFPDTPYVLSINGRRYRGKLQFIANPDSNSFDVVNLVPIESYLAGVVGAEMYSYWEMAALRAQTIAARTYCLYIKERFGARRHWDVRRTQASQVYRGLAVESVRIWKAVNETKGQVLACKQNRQATNTSDKIPNTGYKGAGLYRIFPTYYSSVCGGHTEDSQHVFGGETFAPLVGVPCPYCKQSIKRTSFFWPDAEFDKQEVTKKLLDKYPILKELGKIENITPARQSSYGQFTRLTYISLTGSTKKKGSLFAEDLRLTIDPTGRKIRSTICQITDRDDKWVFSSDRGYGHGVGMCQYGAEAMAREGKNAKKILSYYYPGSKILTIDY